MKILGINHSWKLMCCSDQKYSFIFVYRSLESNDNWLGLRPKTAIEELHLLFTHNCCPFTR